MELKQFWGWFTSNSAKKKSKPKISSVSSTSPQPELNRQATGKRKLTTFVILFILINTILGSSLFYLPGLGVTSSGAASIIAWVLIFIIAILMTSYFAELITLHPTSGGTYEFCKRAYGRFGSFNAGWLIWIAGNFGMALSIVAAAEYFIPNTWANFFIMRILFAAIWIVVLNYMAFRSIDAGVTMLVTFGIIASVVVIFMILPSFISISNLLQGSLQSPFSLELFQPFFRHEGPSIFAFLGLSLLLISEAFFGFEALSYMANEAAEPKKLHKVMFAGIIISGIIMTIYIFSSLGTIPYADYVSNARPFAVQAFNTMGEFGETFVVFGMYLVIVGAAAAWPITGSRLIQAMAKDKIFLRHFAKLHPKHNSPYRAVYFQTIIVFIFSWFIFRGYVVKWGDPYRTIYLIYVVLSLIVLSLVLLSVPILRRKEKDLERPFKAPFGTLGPILLVGLFLLLIINWIRIEGSLATINIQLALSFLVLGLPFYFFVEMLYNPQSIMKVNEKLSFLVVWGEKIFFPLSIKRKIVENMGDVQGKTILEYGCSVGTLTKKLAAKVGPKGKIFATDISLHKTEVTDKKTKHLSQVSVYHHPHLGDFKLKLKRKIDGVISVGTLSYMQNPLKILTNLGKHVKPKGEIVFLDYDKFFYIIPNVTWLQDNQQLINLFSKAGFAVSVQRKRSLLWQYIVVVGIKK